MRSGNVKVLTHWDADGIVSAAKALRKLGEVEVYVPRIGRWSFEAVPPEALGGKLYVMDYSMPYEDWQRLCEGVEGLVVLDHHAAPKPPCGEVYNPALEGNYVPSASLVVSDYFGLPYDWRDAVAIAGDLHDPWGNEVWEAILRKEKVRGEDVVEAAALLNSCYKLLDYDCIYYSIKKVSKANSLSEILEDRRLRAKREEALKLVEELERRAECWDEGYRRVCVVRDERAALVASSLWKRLNRGKETIIVIAWDAGARVYCRGGKKDYTVLIEALRSAGIKEVGGKDVVCSANLRSHELEKVLKILDLHLELPSSVGGEKGP
ncbi:hypothetical protein [Ignicoccus hospitalis]|uniref:Phosphoesterase, DHHA1 n=1 Tax=Ignicoccus hospitalis (strain KIN4/I / DSM 18386 / JCM 14125) TaxID=453591 RepID=A8A9Y7_IGNH4|nr:hypothetical protein [Ignicoccus hospitalis]ABU81739.1 hypothetical protein Igni_0557 [Ignicoccus hospitalis KIN4/I]HIH90004.1 hypothetical protein [Desulfurococcaceae archaeon]